MNVNAVLEYVKSAMNITGTYQDATLTTYIQEVGAYLQDAGVPASVMASTAVYGCIARGVMDLWNYGAGEGKLSSYFRERAIQLAMGRA